MCNEALPRFECRLREASGVPCVEAVGEIDIATASSFRDAILARIPGGERACLLVDLRQVPFMDSEGLRVLLGARIFFPDGLALVGARPTLHRVLTVTGMDRLFVLASTCEEAAGALLRRRFCL